MPLLNAKTIVITGGSMGIGLVIAKKCSKEGATIIITARNKKYLETALLELKKISAKNHNSYSLDVSNLEQVYSFANWCKTKYTEISGIVNCAGIYGPIGRTTNVNMKEFAEAIRINFLGTVYVCHAFAPLL